MELEQQLQERMQKQLQEYKELEQRREKLLQEELACIKQQKLELEEERNKVHELMKQQLTEYERDCVCVSPPPPRARVRTACEGCRKHNTIENCDGNRDFPTENRVSLARNSEVGPQS